MHTTRIQGPSYIPADAGRTGPSASGPFNSDATRTSKSPPPQATEVKDIIFELFGKRDRGGRTEADFKRATALADHCLAPLLAYRVHLFGLPNDLQVRKVVPDDARKIVATDVVDRAESHIRTVAQDILTRRQAGDREGALTLLNDTVRELLNIRSVGVGNLLKCETDQKQRKALLAEMRSNIDSVLSIDPEFPKALYNRAAMLALYPHEEPAKRAAQLAEVFRLIPEAIRLAKEPYGLNAAGMLKEIREGDSDFAPVRGLPGFKAAIAAAQAHLS